MAANDGYTSVCYFVLCTCFPHVNKPHRFGYSFLTDSLCDRECWAALCLYLCRCSHSPLMDKFLCVCVSLCVWKRLFQQASVEWISALWKDPLWQWDNGIISGCCSSPGCSCSAKQQSLHESHFSYDSLVPPLANSTIPGLMAPVSGHLHAEG